MLRRIIGKALVTEIRPEIVECADSLQVCAGQKAGCEAAAYAMNDFFNEAETDAVLFIDAQSSIPMPSHG